MARELGLNPAKLAQIDNHGKEPWKAPLPEFIESLYEQRFGRRNHRPRCAQALLNHAKQGLPKTVRVPQGRSCLPARTRQQLQDGERQLPRFGMS